VQDNVPHVFHLAVGLEHLLIQLKLHHHVLGRGQARDRGHLGALGMLLDPKAAQEV
jgi:hypothetical protein